eukprot:CAMPEP_0178973344 /NCGR_PEP_ID=MMETSP0789-20121207/21668_1 /TAXON_ID=3005 /ORGANISM="Rhizosolenia setigera, Strain CCMP 1694" /LENGTH=316 /DNA_ID=CAMNT_0020661195 /DNA_START=206 /DNA_END=1156 /DNA_ORIENTATION=+
MRVQKDSIMEMTSDNIPNNNEKDVVDFLPQVIISPVKEGITKKGKILMIHGWAQNAQIMCNKTKGLTRKLTKAGYECIFIDGPTLLPESNEKTLESGRENGRGWFTFSKTNPSDTSKAQTGESVTYIGLEESMARLVDIINEHEEEEKSGDESESGCNSYALLAFSQGAVFSHLVSIIAASSSSTSSSKIIELNDSTAISLSPLQKIKCGIFASGFPARHNVKIADHDPSEWLVGGSSDESDSKKNDFSSCCTLPSLHVIGMNDTSVTPDKSYKLVDRFVDAEVLTHEKGHLIPSTSAHCKSMIDFLDKYISTYTL